MSEISSRDFGRSLRSFLEGFLDVPSVTDNGVDFGGKYAPFPSAGIDGFLSHFVFTIQINKGERAGELFTYT